MARLETQINQIYLIHPETKKASLILYDEALNTTHHLFVLAELRDLQKKSEAGDLKKISEIILNSFRSNKKLPAETLFETALAQINQNLADLAHAGRKAWVGKFSCLIALRSGENIYLANNGQTSAWLKRGSEMLEILSAEKRGTHPLKSFQNFTQGKISDQDSLMLLTDNLFDYVSFELFNKILAQSDSLQASLEISKILQDSQTSDQAFCGFFLDFSKKQVTNDDELQIEQSIYAPIPEEIEMASASTSRFKWPKLHFRLPKIPKLTIRWGFFRQLSRPGKFFFVSFALFLVLFAVNIAAYGFKLHSRKSAAKIDQQAAAVAKDLGDLQSALIYKDEKLAFKLLGQTQTDYDTLKKLDSTRISEFSAKLDQLANQVNKTSVVTDPKVAAEFKHHPIYLAKSPSGFLISGLDSNSVSLYDGTKTTDYFMLNSLKSDITSVSFWQPVGVAVASAAATWFIDPNLKQFEPLLPFPDANLSRLKTYNNNLYALDAKNGKLIRITSTKKGNVAATAATGDYSAVRDFAIDKDIFFLKADALLKNSQLIPLPPMTEQMTNATRLFVAGNLYILEPNKKRVVIITKTGALVNQIYFPSSTSPLDLYVDEGQRSMYLLDDNKLLRITF